MTPDPYGALVSSPSDAPEARWRPLLLRKEEEGT